MTEEVVDVNGPSSSSDMSRRRGLMLTALDHWADESSAREAKIASINERFADEEPTEAELEEILSDKVSEC
jgi:hypothetical protein